MGIKNINKFLRNNCPEIYKEIHISEYSFKKVAIDISLYLCKYKSICGDRWLSEFINLVACLRRNEIHCVFIYDNGAPPEKEAERALRAAARDKMEQRVCVLEEALEKYWTTSVVDPVLIELQKKRKNVNGRPSKRLLGKSAGQVHEEKLDITWVENKVKKMRSYILDISPKDFALTKELFDILQVPWAMAPLEAETMCADLCKRGIVDAVLSEDSDCIAYETPNLLTKLNTTTDTCICITYKSVLEGLELKRDEFLDLCIMCGTDYNKNIFRVGPEKAYKFIKQFNSIEGVDKNTTLDVKILNHERGRELFREYEKAKITKVSFCGRPDFDKLRDFMFKYNVRMDVDGLKSSFIHDNFVILEDSDNEKE